MLPFIARALAAVRTAATRVAPIVKRAVKPVVRKPLPFKRPTLVKPNKIISAPGLRPPGGRQPTGKPPAQIPRIDVPPNPGNRGAGDKSFTGDYRKTQAGTGTIPAAKTAEVEAGKAGEDKLNRATSLALLAASAQQLASSFIPSVTWTGSVEARGFKSTPLRDVVHYCLAVVFGMVHQARIGGTNLTVHTHPLENRVEVVFVNSTAMLLEPLNIGIGSFDLQKIIIGAGTDIATFNPINISEFVRNGIKKWQAGNDPKAALDAMIKQFGDLNRALGAGGVWDMAQSNIYAGRAPASLIVDGVQPFDDMRRWSDEDERPMLTRDLSYNPEPPTIPGMDRTHYDLRSLVAQALYDPGVLPPVPDTVVALEQVDLP